ncbi:MULTISPECIES: hypothetical protein [Burkholderia]|uniref:hypothetical protein n=1 Tax=Burkholderia TaxID=32008 RepID=UPI0015A6EAE2|nr:MULTISPECIES: hypothetical protein [Burkholderia]
MTRPADAMPRMSTCAIVRFAVYGPSRSPSVEQMFAWLVERGRPSSMFDHAPPHA